MSWAQRLKRVFRLDLETWEGCGGQVRVVACIEDPRVIAKILEHVDRRAALPGQRPAVRGCVRGLVRCENLAGRGRFRGWSSRTGAQVPCVTGGSSATPPGPGFRQGL